MGVNQSGASLDLAKLKCLRLTEQGIRGERLPGSQAFAEGVSGAPARARCIFRTTDCPS